MTTKRPAGQAHAPLHRSVDQDGVVRVELRQGARERRVWIVGIAAMVALVGLAVATWSWLGPPRASDGQRPERKAPSAGAVVSKGAGSPRGAGPGAAGRPWETPIPTPLASPARSPSGADPEASEEPEAAEDPEATEEPSGPQEEPQGAAGPARVGIGGFPAPGTKRIKQGIVVPDDFPLPPGYVRHFQATDKGQMLEAILMFHPDHKPVDASGNPIPVPADRVVPAEMAPPGLAIELLEVPEDAYADREGAEADTAQ